MAMRFRAHDTFYIRRGWLSKGMKHVNKKKDVFIDKEENPMDVLGIGANMVKALRYWMQAVELTEEPPSGRRVQKLTKLGKKIFEHDRYIEEMGTLYLLQYKMASKKEQTTAWYFFFNEFSMSEFTKEDFILALQNYIKKEGESAVAIRSLDDDFNCIVNTYLPKFKTRKKELSPENNTDCPFAELGLIGVLDKKKKIYKKTKPLINTIDPWIALAIISDGLDGRNEIPINDLLRKPKGIGKVFNLDTIGIFELLNEVEKTNQLKIIRTAGLDFVRINKELNFLECINNYYRNLNA